MNRLILLSLGLALLAGCGVQGGLERPPPLWNAEEAQARETERLERERAEAEARRARPASPTAPVTPTSPADASPTEPPVTAPAQ